VAAPDSAEEEISEVNERLKLAESRLIAMNDLEVNRKVISHASITEGIIEEAEHYDAVVVGAAGDSMYRQILFGNIPETIAKHVNRPVILVKYYQPVKDLIGRVMEE
jgi:nucleotide-binding universal stress UspA family protein